MPIQENLTQDILDSVGEGVFTVDKNFRITFFNRAAEKITGYKKEELLGKSFLKLTLLPKKEIPKAEIYPLSALHNQSDH